MTMSVQQSNSSVSSQRPGLERKLAAYLAATGAVGTYLASEASAVVVFDRTVQPFGVNGEVSIDFNTDGQIDFQVDHDRVDVGGGNVLDYLQIDKNDTNGASLGENPLPINEFDTFDPGASIFPNDTATAAYAIPSAQGDYAAALTQGSLIGPASTWDYQETANFAGTGKTIRANRLIDEDAGQVDMVLGGLTAAQVAVPTNGPNFDGLAGATRYLGVRMEFASNDQTNYGWIGVQITDEAAATGNVVGWGYETTAGKAISAGVPEPGSMVMAAMGGVFLAGGMLTRKLFRGRTN